MTSQPRLIDRDTSTRTKPMRLLVLGLCRTGTSSMYAALEQLGYTPHHMKECMKNPQSLRYWSEAARIRYFDAPGAPYGRDEFDKLLGEYDAVTDCPSAFFATDLMRAYPEAKVILTVRPPHKWHASMLATIWEAYTWRSMHILSYLDPFFVGTNFEFLNVFFRQLCNNDPGQAMIDGYERHNEEVRRAAKELGREFLEYDVVQGWGPLVEFLGVEKPEGEFPNVNDSKHFVGTLRMMRNFRIMVVLAKALVPVAVAGLAWWLYRGR
ncbi:hypothetical protein H2201_002335 [Coniosporium apollinis]|uniref:NAD dependent epimerase/dehydratase n=1 Tax=Coniosporium apollinis TaxID=61459 RepID=A0ABQ9P0G4_9PEZI|nr:hypothetical protein H2201_002335 [Coniosporium apollinis]